MSEYIIFDALNTNLCTAPFMAAKTLLKELYIANQTIQTEASDLGFENYVLNPRAFAEKFAFILAKVSKNGKIIVTLENSSFYSLQYAKNYIINNSSVKNKIDEKLSHFELTTEFLAQVTHIDGFLLSKNILENISKNIKHTFGGFKAAIYVGPYINFDSFTDDNLNKLFDTIKLSRVYFERELLPSGYDIYRYAPKIAAKMAAAILENAFDSGVDFVVVNDVRTFHMFDTRRKELEKAAGRQMPVYILTMPQVVMLSLGITDKNILGFNAHKVKPTILD